MGSNKISWPQYALELARVASLRSADPWVKVGCCLLRHDNSVASLGYNGFPSGMTENWVDRDERRRYVVHAEQNALRFIEPNECYLAASTLLPCNDCLKSLRSYGIARVVYNQEYTHDPSSLVLAEEFGITLTKLDFLK